MFYDTYKGDDAEKVMSFELFNDTTRDQRVSKFSTWNSRRTFGWVTKECQLPVVLQSLSVVLQFSVVWQLRSCLIVVVACLSDCHRASVVAVVVAVLLRLQLRCNSGVVVRLLSLPVVLPLQLRCNCCVERACCQVSIMSWW